MSNANSRPASATEVMDLRREIAAWAQSQQRGGMLANHYGDVKHLPPEVAQFDAMEFQVDVASDGTLTQPDKATVPTGFLADLFEIRGYMQSPLVDPELAPTIYFNIKDVSRPGDRFATDISMANLVDPAGGGSPMHYDRGLYVFTGGSDIKVTFKVDSDGTVGYGALSSAAKRWGVTLMFNLYAV